VLLQVQPVVPLALNAPQGAMHQHLVQLQLMLSVQVVLEAHICLTTTQPPPVMILQKILHAHRVVDITGTQHLMVAGCVLKDMVPLNHRIAIVIIAVDVRLGGQLQEILLVVPNVYQELIGMIQQMHVGNCFMGFVLIVQQ